MGSLERIYLYSFHSRVPHGTPKIILPCVATGQRLIGTPTTRKMSAVLLRFFVSHRDTYVTHCLRSITKFRKFDFVAEITNCAIVACDVDLHRPKKAN